MRPTPLPDHPAAQSPEARASVRAALLAHYDRTRRDLPWRGEDDPYRVLVSEVMLQQTRVETVRAYYEAWLERFPDLESLASATHDEVLEAWEGLGYYRRARNLHAAARMVREREHGELPSSFQTLRELPGVGEYTAGAVASIAFGEAVPAVDGNARRVLARLFDQPAPGTAWLRRSAAALVDPDRPGDWNQALMELGATLCLPRAPRCEACPLASVCQARAAGTARDRPRRARRAEPRKATFALLALVRGGRVLLVRRPPSGLLGGMWSFPEAELQPSVRAERAAGREDGAAARARAAARALAEAWPGGTGGAPSRIAAALAPVEHRFSHLLATYLPYVVELADTKERGSGSTPDLAPQTPALDVRWIDAAEPGRVALPVAQRKVLAALVEHLHTEAR